MSGTVEKAALELYFELFGEPILKAAAVTPRAVGVLRPPVMRPRGVMGTPTVAAAVAPEMTATKATGFVAKAGAGRATRLNGPLGAPRLGGPVTRAPASHRKLAGLQDVAKRLYAEVGEGSRGYMLGVQGMRDAAGNVIKEPSRFGAWLSQTAPARAIGVTPKWTHEQIARARAANPNVPGGQEFLAGFLRGKKVRDNLDTPELIGELSRQMRRPDGRLTPFSAARGLQSTGLVTPDGIGKAFKQMREYSSGTTEAAGAEARRRAILAGAGAGAAGLGAGAYLASRRRSEQSAT